MIREIAVWWLGLQEAWQLLDWKLEIAGDHDLGIACNHDLRPYGLYLLPNQLRGHRMRCRLC